MQFTKEQLHTYLVEPGHIPPDDFTLLAEQSETTGVPLVDLLIQEGKISEDNLGRAIAFTHDYRYADIGAVKVLDSLLNLIPEPVARAQSAFIYEETDGSYKLATTKPDNFAFIKMLEQKVGKQIDVYYCTEGALTSIFRLYKGNVGEKIQEILTQLEERGERDEQSQVAYVVMLVNIILDYAHNNKASDIHLEPLEEVVSVRFRIDGILHETARYPNKIHEQLVSRIKILARLRTDEHASPQDGRFVHVTQGGMFDVRVSIMPVTDGENIVMRLLVKQSRRLGIHELGLQPDDKQRLENSLRKSNGMILVVGPTGSGKTTSLYTVLQALNTEEVNIMTIEDPVEYNVSHIQQIQVSHSKDLTFANGLRSIVRQDPDIIMVGEIRDKETAKIAVNAAMTGHLLLSTLHTNDAATTFPRLVEMGIEPFLVASSVIVVIAQRLVRTICSKCRSSHELTNEEIQSIQGDPLVADELRRVGGDKNISELLFYKGDGCYSCGSTGYSGRVGVFEILVVNDAIRPHILKRESAGVIDQVARSQGMTSILSDGLTKALNGVTTLEEVLRVTRVSL